MFCVKGDNAKSIDSYEAADDLGQNLLLFVNFLQVKGPTYIVINLFDKIDFMNIHLRDDLLCIYI